MRRAEFRLRLFEESPPNTRTMTRPIQTQNGTVELSVDQRFTWTDGRVDLDADDDVVRFVDSGIPHAALKIQQASVLLDLMERYYNQQAMVHYCLEGIANAIYGFWEIVKVVQGSVDYRRIRERRQKSFRDNPEFNALLNYRNQTTHTGTKRPKLVFKETIAIGKDGAILALRAIDEVKIPGFPTICVWSTIPAALKHLTVTYGLLSQTGALNMNPSPVDREVSFRTQFVHQRDDGAWQTGRPGVDSEANEPLDDFTNRLVESARAVDAASG